MYAHRLSIAVLGAGHGGLALAGYLAVRGHRVALWNRSLERIAPVRSLGGVRLTLPGAAPVLAPIARASCSMGAVLADAGMVLVAVPASGHAEVARQCAAHLRSGQTVLLLPGRTGGALEFHRVLQTHGCQAHILLGETNTFPFASRCLAPATATIFGIKSELLAATLPATRTDELLAECSPLLPMLAPAASVLQTGLANLGAILHPTITLLNAGRIERGETFDFYADGVTAKVADVLAAADMERLSIAREYRVPACSLPEWIADAYGHHASTIEAAVGGNPAYAGIKAPNTLDHRYLLEDVPTGLVPLIELGETAGLNLPTLNDLVASCRAKLGGQPWHNQRTLDVLGLDGLNCDEIRRFVDGRLMPAAPSRLTAGLPSRAVSSIWSDARRPAFAS